MVRELPFGARPCPEGHRWCSGGPAEGGNFNASVRPPAVLLVACCSNSSLPEPAGGVGSALHHVNYRYVFRRAGPLGLDRAIVPFLRWSSAVPAVALPSARLRKVFESCCAATPS